MVRVPEVGGRPRILAGVVVLGVVVAAAVVTGILLAATSHTHFAYFTMYPVAQSMPGTCPAGTHGVAGEGPRGETCYQVTDGMTVNKITDVHTQPSKGGGYDVSVTLMPADTRNLAGLSRRTVGKDIALVVQHRVVAALRVEMPITQGKIVIAGNYTKPEADALVQQLIGEGKVPPPSPPPPTPTPTTPTPVPTGVIPSPSIATTTAPSPSPTPSLTREVARQLAAR